MIVVTLGGNALLPGNSRGTIEEQIAISRIAMQGVADLVASGTPVVLSHGNGPIVGNIVIRNEAARDLIPPMPLDVCGADSQGGIGYMLQQVLGNALQERGVDKTVVSLVTQCVVDPRDPAFARPTKPIGPFFPRGTAESITRRMGWTMTEDSGRGFRRVVPSPKPVEIVEWEAIERLVHGGVVVIAAGGGGVPVVREGGAMRGVEAVIDKDHAAAVLARQLKAERLAILTAVSEVALDFGKPTQRGLARLTPAEARAHLAAGQFPPGSMGPKMEAAIAFVEGGGAESIITSPESLRAAIEGRAGTRIVADAGGSR
jgi:carbamate kinase